VYTTDVVHTRLNHLVGPHHKHVIGALAEVRVKGNRLCECKGDTHMLQYLTQDKDLGWTAVGVKISSTLLVLF